MNILLYVGIFLAKMIEVSLSTVRVVLVNRGEKFKGAIIGFVEILIWIILVANVLSNVTEDPIKVVVYCLAFSCGIYLGVVIEDKLAIGMASIQAVVGVEDKDVLSQELRGKGFGVTVMEGQGMGGTVDIFLVYLKRKSLKEATALIKQHCPNAVVTVNDVRTLKNGFIRK